MLTPFGAGTHIDPTFVEAVSKPFNDNCQYQTLDYMFMVLHAAVARCRLIILPRAAQSTDATKAQLHLFMDKDSKDGH